jgi:glycogen debranching enzyme
MLVEGQSFCLSDDAGDIHADTPHGLFIGDLRVLSRCVLLLDDQPIESLAHHFDGASTVEHIGRNRAQHPGSQPLVVVRRRTVGAGLRDEIELRNYGATPTTTLVTLLLDADFADLFAVKEHRAERRGEHHVEILDGAVAYEWRHRDARRRVVIEGHGDPSVVRPSSLQWAVRVVPRQVWKICVDVVLQVGDDEVRGSARCGAEASRRGRVSTTWQRDRLRCASASPALDESVQRSLDDLAALRLHDMRGEDLPVIAAGAPWFMTLFGRDALLAAWMALPVDPALALGVLRALARHQGTEDDAATEEQPGRILHEMRWGEASTLSLGGGHVYYGTADATPLFVALLGELVRWGGIDDADLRALLPHVDAALDWVHGPGDPDGDGYVEYLCPTAYGLRNQGWKDSWDGVRFADGSVAEPPIALSEVQAYVYAALRARAVIARRLADDTTAVRCDEEAQALQRRFSDDFVLPDGRLAFGLDGSKRPIDANVSNAGHALWCGVLSPDRVAGVVDGLMAPGLWSGWGVRTMSSDDVGYDPMSYHCGSVWPHDNALAAAGLRRAGRDEAASALVEAQLDVAASNGGRLPELFSGLARDDIAVPVRFPTSCSPQAWSAASPFLHLRTVLGFEPRLDEGRIYVEPALPASFGDVTISGVVVAGRAVTVFTEQGSVRIEGLPPGIEVVVGRPSDW